MALIGDTEKAEHNEPTEPNQIILTKEEAIALYNLYMRMGYIDKEHNDEYEIIKNVYNKIAERFNL